jgi:hypothetical protein
MIKKIYERKCANKSCGANFKPTSNTQRDYRHENLKIVLRGYLN